MKIIVNGAGGRMGRALRTMMENRGTELAAAVDPFVSDAGMLANLSAFTGEADCIIDFSNHAGTAELMKYAVEKNLPVVIATTGHTEDELDLIREAAKCVPVFYSGNMSLGIALLTELARTAAKMFPDADVEIVESHHNQKLDVPSGTALLLANRIREARTEATLLVGRHENGKRTAAEIGIHSLRYGNEVGTHEIIISTGRETLTLKHEAENRALFADGALSAATFLCGKAPGMYNMQDIVG